MFYLLVSSALSVMEGRKGSKCPIRSDAAECSCYTEKERGRGRERDFHLTPACRPEGRSRPPPPSPFCYRHFASRLSPNCLPRSSLSLFLSLGSFSKALFKRQCRHRRDQRQSCVSVPLEEGKVRSDHLTHSLCQSPVRHSASDFQLL